MAKRRFGIIVLLLSLCLSMLSVSTFAASDTMDAIDTDRECALTLSYTCDGVAFPDLEPKLYKVADVSADFQYALTSPFAASGLILNGIQTQGEWNVVRSTLDAYILANDLSPLSTAATDASGMASFGALKPGLYLVSSLRAATDDLNCGFASALIALPGLDGGGEWLYQVAATPKSEILPPPEPDEETELKILILWSGDDHNDRPESVQVDIFRNGAYYDTAILSEESDWAHKWMTKDDGADWMVGVSNVPEGYKLTINRQGNTFILTCSRISGDLDGPTVRPPQTGDTTNILLYTVLMYVSGATLIILAIIGRRKGNDEKDKS